MNSRSLGLFGALGATLAWGGQFPVFGSVLHQLDAFWLTAIRGVAGSLILIALLVAIEGPKALRLGERPWQIVGLGVIGFTVFGVFLLVGVGLSGPHHGALIMATTPLLATLLTWLGTGKRPSARTLGFTAMALAGVVLVVTRGNLATIASEGSLLGDVFILIGALAWAAYTLAAPSYAAWSPLRFSTLTIATGTAGLLIVTLAATTLGVAHVPTAAAFGAALPGMAYLVVLGQVFAIFTWTLGIKYLGSARALLFMNAVPIVTFAIEFALGERFHVVEYAGAAITIAALVLNNIFTAVPSKVIARGTCPAESRVLQA